MQKMHKKANATIWAVAVVVVLVVVGFVGYNLGWFDKFIGDDNEQPECGDGVCEGTEDLASCAEDCLTECDVETCGNGVCKAQCGETETTCVADCQGNPCADEVCGNSYCNANCGETETSCQVDCEEDIGQVPIEQLNGNCKDKFTMAAVTTGNLSFYTPGADVSDPYTLFLDQVGCGSNTTNLVVQTDTGYDVYYDAGGATYYDEKLTSWNINYNPSTGKGFLLVGGKSYYATAAVGAFVDVDTLPEVQTGMVNNGTDFETYNESVLGGSGWWQMDIGNDNANSEIRDFVLCFRDSDGDLEGNEVTAFTASYVSGSTAISIPGSLQQYWEDAAGSGSASCVKIADNLGGSQKARWQFTMTISEANFVEDSEEFEMSFDDLGDYLAKQYPSRNAKATAETLSVGTTV